MVFRSALTGFDAMQHQESRMVGKVTKRDSKKQKRLGGCLSNFCYYTVCTKYGVHIQVFRSCRIGDKSTKAAPSGSIAHRNPWPDLRSQPAY